MTSIKVRLNRTRLGRDATYPVVIQVIRHRRKREITTLFRLRASEFDPVQERAVPPVGRQKCLYRYGYEEMNAALTGIKDELEQLCRRLEKRGEYTVEKLVEAYHRQNDMRLFFTYAEALIGRLKEAGRCSTAANYRSAVQAFARFADNPGLKFTDLTPSLLDDFASARKRQGNSLNTVAFYLRHLRAVYNKAVAEGLTLCDPSLFRHCPLRGSTTRKRALGYKELSRIAELNLEAEHPHLELARDLFLFSFYTRGMAFVDMCYLRKENIEGNTLVYRRRKTGQALQVKIEAPLRALLKKYASPTSPYLLPMLRGDDSYAGYRYIQRRLNKRIHEIGVRAGFGFALTFYAARHTWATLARNSGVPVSVISEGMGHTSEKTTRIYLAGMDATLIDRANRKVLDCWKGKRCRRASGRGDAYTYRYG